MRCMLSRQPSRRMPHRMSARLLSATPGSCIYEDATQSPALSHETLSDLSSRPGEILGEHRVSLLERLDSTDQPFNVHIAPLSRKRKRSDTPPQVQENLFDERLAVKYKVEPWKDWKRLRRYKRFTVGSESIATGDFILVSHDINEDPAFDSFSDWKAKVLEVRALDMEHVYVRVSWLNRPEDLKGGRRDYHGRNELVPTNQMDVINARAVNGTFELIHHDQLRDDNRRSGSGKDIYFWRQTFDFTTRRLSTLQDMHS